MPEMYVGEAFMVYLIRRGLFFWSGTDWKLAPYNARLYGTIGEAQKVVETWQLKAEDDDQITIRLGTLVHH